jgi:glycosyltransferase involved in cell wall biosynthesis
MTTMRVAIVTDGLFPLQVGGMQNHSTQLAIHLAMAGAQVEVFFSGSPRDAGNPALAPLVKAGVALTAVQSNRPPRFPGHYRVWLERHSRAVAKSISERPPFHWIYVQGLSGVTLSGQAFRPARIALNPHGLEMFQRAGSLRSRLEQLVLQPLARQSLRHADVVFSLGGRLTELIESLGVPRHRVEEVPVGIREDWIAEAPLSPRTPRRLIFVGRHERRKGLEELLAAIRSPDLEPNFHLKILGPPIQRHNSASVTWIGPVADRTQMIAALGDSDIIVCPSWAEGMPTVILEGMARGLAVIATDVGAVNNLVFRENGWLVPAGDIAALTFALREAVTASDEDLLHRKAFSLDLVREKFAWPFVARETLRILASRGISTG